MHPPRFLAALLLALVCTALTLAAATPSVDLGWTDRSANETGFTIERAVGPAGAFQVLANVPANATTYTDTAVTFGQTYRYRVAAYNGAGASSFSNVATATLPAAETIPAAPGDATATPVTPPPYTPPAPTISLNAGETLTIVALAN